MNQINIFSIYDIFFYKEKSKSQRREKKISYIIKLLNFPKPNICYSNDAYTVCEWYYKGCRTNIEIYDNSLIKVDLDHNGYHYNIMIISNLNNLIGNYIFYNFIQLIKSIILISMIFVFII